MPNKILLASDNVGKLKEIGEYLKNAPIEFIPQGQFNIPPVEETGLSFVENAILKARNGAKHSQLPCLADDSGLCVEALNGAPGIYSARYAGPEANMGKNIHKLLEALKNVPAQNRGAYFYCALVLVRHENDPTPLIFQGRWDGQIVTQARGQNGFGYDPIFFVPELNCTAAQLSPEQKNQLSHRAKALQLLVQHLNS